MVSLGIDIQLGKLEQREQAKDCGAGHRGANVHP
jgi:hypothetical protein